MTKITAGYEYTDAELLALYREALAKVSVTGESYKIGDREFTSHDLPEIRNQITWLEQRINQTASGLAINKVKLNRASS